MKESSSKKNKSKKKEVENDTYDPNFEPDYPSHRNRKKKSVVESIIDGMNLIVIGILLLLNTTGIVGWGVWWRIVLLCFKLWPLMIIWIGIQIILSWSKPLRLIGKIFGLGLFIVIVMIAASGEINNDGRSWVEKNLPFLDKISVDKDQTETDLRITSNKYLNVDKRNIDIKLTAGVLELEDSNSQDHLNINSYHYEDFGVPVLKDDLKNSTLNISFEPKFKSQFFNFLDREIKYDFEIGQPDVETNLDLDMTAGKSEVNFDDLDIDTIKLKMTAGDFNANFSQQSLPESFEIKLTAGDCDIQIPSNIQINIDYNVTAGSLKIGDEEFNWGKGTKTINQEATTEIDFEINITAGAVKIEY